MDNRTKGRDEKLFNGNARTKSEKKIPQIIINKSIYIFFKEIPPSVKDVGKVDEIYKMVLFSRELLSFVSVAIAALAVV